MNPRSEIVKYRKQLDYASGVRRVFVLARLSELLSNVDLNEALALAREAEELARRLLSRLESGDKRLKKYQQALGRALTGLGVCYLRTEEFPEAARILEEAVDLLAKTEIFDEMLSALYSLLTSLRELKQAELGIDKIQFAIEICRELDWKDLEGLLYAQMGSFYEIMGQGEKALEAFQKAMDIIDLYKPDDKAHVYAAMGAAYFRAKRFEESCQCFEQAIPILEELGNVFALVIFLQNYATVLRAIDKHPKALELLEQGLDYARKGGYPLQEARILKLLCTQYTQLGEYDRALAGLMQALELYRKEDNPDDVVAAHSQLADIYITLGDEETGGRELAEALKNLTPDMHSEKAFSVLQVLVRNVPPDCPPEDLVERLQSLIGHMSRVGPTFAASVKLSYGIALENAGRKEEAAEAFQEVLEMCKTLHAPCMETEALFYLGKLSAAQGAVRESLEYWEQAREPASRCSDWKMRRLLEYQMATIHEQQGQHDKALMHAKKAYAMEKEVFLKQSRRRVDRLIVSSAVNRLQDDCTNLQIRLDTANQALEAERQKHSLVSAKVEQTNRRRRNVLKILKSAQQSNNTLNPDALRALIGNVDRAITESSFDVSEAEHATFNREFEEHLRERYPKLTESERKVCAGIVQELSNKDIARAMHVSARAIETYRYRARRKLALPSGTDLKKFLKELFKC